MPSPGRQITADWKLLAAAPHQSRWETSSPCPESAGTTAGENTTRRHGLKPDATHPPKPRDPSPGIQPLPPEIVEDDHFPTLPPASTPDFHPWRIRPAQN